MSLGPCKKSDARLLCTCVELRCCGLRFSYIVAVNVSKPGCGFGVCQRVKTVCDTRTRSDSNIRDTRLLSDGHTPYPYMCVCNGVRGGSRGSADRLAVAVKLAPFFSRCQVFALAARPALWWGAKGLSLCQGCWIAVDAREGGR